MSKTLKTLELLEECKLSELTQVKDIDTDTIDFIFSELHKYYKDNKIVDKISKEGGIVVYPDSVLQTEKYLKNFLKRAYLYCDKIVLNDDIFDIVHPIPTGVYYPSDEHRPLTLDAIKSQLSVAIPKMMMLKELIEEGIVVLVPSGDLIRKNYPQLTNTSMGDMNNETFRNTCIKNMEVKTGSDTIIKWKVNQPFINLEVIMGLKQSQISLITSMITTGNENLEELKKRMVDTTIFSAAYDINKAIYLSSLMNARLVTGFDVYWELLNKKLSKLNSKALVVPSILSMELKYLDNIPLSKIVKARKQYSSTFEDFRISLENFIHEINDIPSTENFIKNVKELERNKIEPEIRKLDREFSRIQKNRILRGASISIGSIIGSFFTGGISVAAGIAGLIKEGADWQKEEDTLKENSMYFLWKMKK